MLRPYQSRAITMLYDWLSNNSGNPCLVLPTGSGKSHIVAALCKDAVQSWPETRILMLTHQKELIEQNAEKMRLHWRNAPLGIYSASIGSRQLGKNITFAGIQSVRKKARLIGHIDLVIIDEAHTVSHRDEGGYRTLLNDLVAINPAMRVIGLTATPYRLGHGLITDKPAIFDALIEPVTIAELIVSKHLAPLRSKITRSKLDTSGVHKRGGEYIESELQAAVDNDQSNQAIVDEVIALAGDRQSWLFFCAGVQHAQHICEALLSRGIVSECVTGDTPKKERERILHDYKSGKIRALTNANVLTTGFDAPNIDLIAMLRPTLSPGLYVQMAGRGMRLKDHADHCLVLDFAGCVQTHGPITNVQPPDKAGKGEGDAPIKVCNHCHEICHASVRECPNCGEPFPEPEKKKLKLRNDDIMGLEAAEMSCTGWKWSRHISAQSGKEMVKVTYYGDLSDTPVKEYLCILHEGYAGQKALRTLAGIAQQSGATIPAQNDLDALCEEMNEAQPPALLKYRKSGKFFEVESRQWN